MTTEWAIPLHSKGEVDRAGRALLDDALGRSDRSSAVSVVNNWRAAHGFPLNTLQVNLRDKARAVDSEALVAQRTKRLPSIVGKLRDRPDMRLSRMQDIGGCRAVVSSIDAVDDLVNRWLTGRHKHRLIRHDDYIAGPKATGYRGHHLVYRYFSDRKKTYNGQSIEIQIRTKLQHTWATSVETAAMFTRQALKSSRGDADWLEFFALMSSEIARTENSPHVEGSPGSRRELRKEIKRRAEKIDVLNRLSIYSETLQHLDFVESRAGHRFFVLDLNLPVDGEPILYVHSGSNLQEATTLYDELEIDDSVPRDVVLVSVDAVTSLRRAFPNYYADTGLFRDLVREAITF
ncbi:hypothetical protein [Aeromicrobium sp. CTD01-1L150]|uniref:hypothetical protein n=1 Tax=Aeromicrobium sp. CTD01-1L150 TaxID=3341830 RepID=UPI0035C0660D